MKPPSSRFWIKLFYILGVVFAILAGLLLGDVERDNDSFIAFLVSCFFIGICGRVIDKEVILILNSTNTPIQKKES